MMTRLDALAMAVAHWSDQMAQDVEDQMAARQEERLMNEVEKTKQNAALGFAVIVGHQTTITTHHLNGKFKPCTMGAGGKDRDPLEETDYLKISGSE